ncbi:MAG: DivIVA domain-containing protein [Verrucomicrobiales bacterium]|jgi:DivIVA domain-containing protein
MLLNDGRLTGRDVLAKTFQAKTKRGYDPIEVDAYLELVAAQIDVLHGDLGRANSATPTEMIAIPSSGSGELERANADLSAELQTLRAERDVLSAQLGQYSLVEDALRSENQQLRAQLTQIAPPPPVPSDAMIEPVAPVPAPANVVGHDERASEESLELVLRMARKSAEETISEAHNRADQIVAHANLTASEIAKESDRKAYEAANSVQAELVSLNTEIEIQKGAINQLQARTEDQRNELREMAQRIIWLADGEPRRHEGAEVVDLRQQPSGSTPV